MCACGGNTDGRIITSVNIQEKMEAARAQQEAALAAAQNASANASSK